MISGTRCIECTPMYPYVNACECEVARGVATPKGTMTYASSVSVIVKGEVRVWALRYELQLWAFRLEWGLGFGP